MINHEDTVLSDKNELEYLLLGEPNKGPKK